MLYAKVKNLKSMESIMKYYISGYLVFNFSRMVMYRTVKPDC